MGKIRILDEHIANQIAAGEVVERPSSVVKELVENAIDAGSTRIDVTIEEGGLKLIRITDNGSGIEPDDCETAFQRHATSKISTGSDLFRIRTLGFRGEALPSIAAVSRMECITSADNSGLGKKIVIEGGQLLRVENVAAPRGTDIVVRDLFYNTPARLKYMKTIQTELGHVSDFLYRLALANPHIAFCLKHNGNVMLRTLGNGDLLQVIAAVYGSSVARSMLPLQGENIDYTLSGYVSRPELTRANRSAVSVVVNGRYIRNYGLVQSLLGAYHTLLPAHRYPVAILRIGMDPSLVDVNVHPSKLEVRFSKEAELHKFVEGEIKRVLRDHVLIPQLPAKPASKPAVVQEQMEMYHSPPEPPRAQPALYREQAGLETEEGKRKEKTEKKSENPLPQVGQVRNSRNDGPAASGGAFRQRHGWPLPEAQEASPPLPKFPQLSPVGQVHGTYIVAQNEDGLFLIDQHAAHERINYEYYYEKFGVPEQASQELLVPVTLDFTPAEAETIRHHLPLLEQVGFYLEPFGGQTFLVRAYPHWLPQGAEKEIIEEVTDWILTEKKAVDLSRLREKSAILCSCKASIKANHSLSSAEMTALLQRLGECRNPYTCPHGRPVVVSFSVYELEKMFKRVM